MRKANSPGGRQSNYWPEAAKGTDLDWNDRHVESSHLFLHHVCHQAKVREEDC